MDKYSGKTLFYGQNIDFEIEDCYLTLFVPGDITQEIMYFDMGNGVKELGEKQPLKMSQLLCITNDGYKNIECYFDPLSYGYNSKNMFCGPSTFTIPLKRYIVYDLTKKSEKCRMIYFSKHIHKLTNLVPFPRFESNEGKKYIIDCDFPSLKLTSKFNIDDYEIEMKPTYKTSFNGPIMDFTPGLELLFNKPVKNDDIEKFYTSLIRFVHYCSMRTNIFPESFIISNGVIDGEIFSYFLPKESDKEDLNSVYRDSFSWDVLYKNAGSLFTLIYNNSIYIMNNQENRRLRLAISYESISKDAAAFEYEFDSLYPDGIPYSTERKQIEDEVVSELNPLLENSTGKKRKIYKSFVRNIHLQSLGDKIEFALDQFSDGLINVKNIFKIKYTNEEIGEFCRAIRNDVDHGNKINEITNDSVLSYIVLRCLIYAMQLKKANFEFEDINVLIILLYSIKGAPR